MGDMADYALEQIMDWDEAVLNGYYDDLDNWEDGMVIMLPFYTEPGPHGPGLFPKCNATTKLKDGRYGSFYGCSNYPHCNGSRSC